MNLFVISALFAVTAFQMPAPRAAAPIAASRPTVAVQAQTQNQRPIYVNRPFFRPQPPEASTCRLGAFFGSDAARPLETVYFARPGSPCAGAQYYGFVFLGR